MEFKILALSEIWAGGPVGKDNMQHLTGIKGSLRWWYEVLIRGLGSYACDPVDKNNRCQLRMSHEYSKNVKKGETRIDDLIKERICAVSYLFGCTGWSSKLIFRIYHVDNPFRIFSKNIKTQEAFILRLTEAKQLEPAEKILLDEAATRQAGSWLRKLKYCNLRIYER